MDEISRKLAHVRERIATAAATVGRQPDAIKLIAVSKTHTTEAIETAIGAGQRVFGESTAQEALTKLSQFRSRDLEWHFIGHLQSNKARFIPGHFSWLHSLDSLKLAQRLARLAQQQHADINALIEINATGDPNKHGVLASDVFSLLEQLLSEKLPNIAVRGLMTIGPYPASEATIRTTYAALRRLRDDCQSQFDLTDFSELSMGMSGDYIEGIKEGATMVRVGTAIFGTRDYSK